MAQPIIGNSGSIESMDACMLQKCFQKFYSIENMKIIIIGELNPEEVYDVIERALANSPVKEKERFSPFIPVKRESLKIEQINSTQSVLFWGMQSLMEMMLGILITISVRNSALESGWKFFSAGPPNFSGKSMARV